MSIGNKCIAPTSGGCALEPILGTELCEYHTQWAKLSERRYQDRQQAIADGYVPQKPNTEHTSRMSAENRQARKRKAGSREAT